jgi:hypothetical protein
VLTFKGCVVRKLNHSTPMSQIRQQRNRSVTPGIQTRLTHHRWQLHLILLGHGETSSPRETRPLRPKPISRTRILLSRRRQHPKTQPHNPLRVPLSPTLQRPRPLPPSPHKRRHAFASSRPWRLWSERRDLFDHHARPQRCTDDAR